MRATADSKRRSVHVTPSALLLVALAVRAIVAARTLVPARDAESYLWMAEQIAAGDFGAAFRTVFHPGYSLLIAGWLTLWPTTSTVIVGQVIGCTLGALAVLPLWAMTARVYGTAAATWAGAIYALGNWFARHPADCLSEGPFLLVVAMAMRELTTERRGVLLGGTLGGLTAIGYTLRPEAAALVLLGAPFLWFVRRERGAALLSIAIVAGAVAALGVGWANYGGGFTLTPKAAFNYEQGVGAAPGEAIAHYLTHLLRVPGAAWEAIGFVAMPLAVLGLWRARPWVGSVAMLWLAIFALQCLVVPALRSNVRFFAGFGVLVLPFAGVGAQVVWSWLAARRGWRVGFVVVLFAADIARVGVVRRADRVVLIELGVYLRDRLRAGEVLVTEMPRLAYFAGQPPLPPRPIDGAELLRASANAGVRYLAFVDGRTEVDRAALERLGFRPHGLPGALAESASARGVLVFERTE